MTPELGNALAPLLLVGGTAVAALLAIGAYRQHLITVFVTVLGLLTALIASLLTWHTAPQQIGGLLTLDPYARFFGSLFLFTTLLLVLLSYGTLDRREAPREEYYVLLLLATLGAMVLAASSHFISFFLGLELLSISLYALVAYQRTRPLGLEAALKYLIMASVSSAFLLLGMALLYAQTGTMRLAAVSEMDTNLLPGLVLLLVAIGFKLALVPFHLWAPDVYEGAPPLVAAFIASISKASVFALLLRLSQTFGFTPHSPLALIMTTLAVFSMTVGNLLALRQSNLKRLLAYSSIAHMGYLLVPLLAGGPTGASVALFYLVTYFAAIVSAFGVISLVSPEADEPGDLSAYRGLAWRRPWAAALLIASLFSLAGLPLTAGFPGKFLVLTAGVGHHLWLLVIVLVINSTLGLYYYLRVISTLTVRGETQPRPQRRPLGAAVALALLGIAIVWLGVYPSPLLITVQEVVAGFGR
jgi:NADH-quinone oxidoreductase subunit N